MAATSSSRRSFADTASFKSSTPSGPPPSYSRHHNDELLNPSINFRVRSRLSMPVFARPARRADPSLMLQVLSAPGPLHLTIDNGMIYPPPPSNALYHLPRVLTWSGNEIFLFRSLPSSTRNRHAQPPRDLALYTMRRTPFTNEVALIPRREGLSPATMHGRRSLLSGMTWEVEVRKQIKLRYAKGKWRDGLGNIVAEENPGEREGIVIVGQNLEVYMKDLIVAAWATRMWQGHGRLSLTRTLMSGKGSLREAILPLWTRKKPDHVHRRTIAALSTPWGPRQARPFETLLLRGRR